MKRYKLKKDLPTFKAGQECWLAAGGHLFAQDEGGRDIIMYGPTTLAKYPNILTEWFEEIPERPKTVRDLKDGEDFYVLSTGGIVIGPNTWSGVWSQEREMGNVFLTEEEAEKEHDRRIAKVILEQDTNGFKPDWRDSSQSKYFVDWSNRALDFHIERCTYMQTEQLPFATAEDAEASIKAHPKEWKTYLGVEE